MGTNLGFNEEKKRSFGIAFCHQKGGVGKSTSVAVLGASLAQMGISTLMFDLDPSGNLTAGFGLNPDEMSYSTADVLSQGEIKPEYIVPTGYSGLDLLPSNPDMLSFARTLFEWPDYETRLKSALARSGLPYEAILIDCPPNFDSITISALTAVDLAVIPTQCEFYSLQALENVFKLIRVVRTRTNPQLRYRLLVTMFDKRGAFHRNVLKMIQDHYSSALLETVIGFDTKVRESQLAGVPLPVYAPTARAAEQYRKLAQELQAYA